MIPEACNESIARLSSSCRLRFSGVLFGQFYETYDAEGRASSVRVVESIRRLLLKGRSGARLSLKQALVTLDKGSVRFSPGIGKDHGHETDSGQGKRESLALPVPSTVYWARTNQQIHVQLMTRRAAEEMGRAPSQGLVLFDADRFSEPLLIRAWQAGDRFFPHGNEGEEQEAAGFLYR